MAITIDRQGWLQLFTQMRSPNNALTRFFTPKPGAFFSGNKVAIDIQRFGEDVAIVVKKCTGPNLNDIDEFTTKEFMPPAYNEGFPLNVCDLLDRMAGVDPITAAGQGYAAQLVMKMAQGFSLMDDKIKRAMELQASQILQTGKLSLTDEDGAVAYELDFKPKATHFPTSSTTWGQAGDDKIGDLEALAEVIRADGKVDCNVLIMGASALREFIKDEDVQKNLDNRRITMGEIMPQMVASGMTLFSSSLWIGSYEFSILSYKDTYKHPQTGAVTKYIDDGKVIMTSDATRLDIVAAKVALPLGPDPRVASLLPGRMSSRDAGFDVTPNVYCTPNGKQIMGELESRPLLIPVQIDGFGCLDTGL